MFKAGKANGIIILLSIGFCITMTGCGNNSPKLPVTAKKPVINSYFDTKVVDNYQWLENSDDPTVKKWVESQSEYARSILDKLPARAAIADKLRNLYFDKASNEYNTFQFQNNLLFALKKQPPKDQSLLVVLESPNNLGTERAIIDPNLIDTTGKSAIDFYVASPTAKYVAVSISNGGTEDGDVYVYEVASGKKLNDYIPRVNGPTAGGDVAWNPDESGFLYTHYRMGVPAM